MSSIDVEIPDPQVAVQHKPDKIDAMEDIDALVQNQCWDHLMPNDTSSGTDAFYVDIRRCDYEAELSKQFGGHTARYRKPQLIQKKEEWPPILSSGLKGAMREDSFEITHSSHYKQLEIQMINGYLTNDADRIVPVSYTHLTLPTTPYV